MSDDSYTDKRRVQRNVFAEITNEFTVSDPATPVVFFELVSGRYDPKQFCEAFYLSAGGLPSGP